MELGIMIEEKLDFKSSVNLRNSLKCQQSSDKYYMF